MLRERRARPATSAFSERHGVSLGLAGPTVRRASSRGVSAAPGGPVLSSLDIWKGPFGDEYTDRQHSPDPAPTLRGLLQPWWDEIHRVLEVGCNAGRNLSAFSGKDRIGVEPNPRAAATARQRYRVVDGNAGALPFSDGSMDLVFTAGVLIHIAPAEFDRALHEIVRVSRRFVLAVEYLSTVEQAVEYRGHPDGIWKRNYGHEFMDRYPLRLVGNGGEELAGS